MVAETRRRGGRESAGVRCGTGEEKTNCAVGQQLRYLHQLQAFVGSVAATPKHFDQPTISRRPNRESTHHRSCE